MNNKKFAFITCVNNEIYFTECQYYINRLIVPIGYEIEIHAIQGATSMCSAYNTGMNRSDARYKIYLHQDVYIRNPDFLQNILDIFQSDDGIGMIGMLGGNNMPASGVAYRAWNEGMVDCREPDMSYYLVCNPEATEHKYVEAIDGLMMITQYDILWREDLFHHFDFYDVSQSFEMRKKGYQIVVPYQQTPWVIHNSNFVKQSHYDEGRKICLREYPEFFYAKGGFDFSFNEEWEQLSDMLAAEVQNLIEQSHWSEVAEIIAAYRNGKQKSSQLEILAILSDIFQSEKKANVKNSFFSEVDTYESIITKYMNLCFLLRRIELNFDAPAYADLETMIRSNTISYETIISILLHCIVDQKAVIIKLITFYSESNQVQNVAKAQAVYEYLKDRSIPIAYSQSRPNS